MSAPGRRFLARLGHTADLACSSDTTVVALSTEVGLATRAVARGAAAFISKSQFDPDRLIDAWSTARG